MLGYFFPVLPERADIEVNYQSRFMDHELVTIAMPLAKSTPASYTERPTNTASATGRWKFNHVTDFLSTKPH